MESLPPDIEIATKHAQEILTLEDLVTVFSRKEKPRGYVGVEPSGLFHIGWVVWVQKLNQLVDLGVRMEILLATWHAQINDKLGGNIERIRQCAEYLRHCFTALNIDLRKVHVITAEDLMRRLEYWERVLRVAKSLTLARVRRSTDIMGRSEEEASLDFSKLIYPCLQVTDIIDQKYEICLSGMDQRRAHVLAREVADKMKLDWKPVGIHVPLLPGLSGDSRMDVATDFSPQDLAIASKMSKSKPGDAILIHDAPREIMKKIRNAYCPAETVEGNPILSYIRHLLFTRDGFTLHIERAEKYGGSLSVTSADELDALYAKGAVHPLDLKQAAAQALTEFLQPVRKYFEENTDAAKCRQAISEYQITR
ncbi:MAG: tyrosine--tRNA ligase [Candidatus Hodarchaeota archaeon]